jgi:hypothetical protein
MRESLALLRWNIEAFVWHIRNISKHAQIALGDKSRKARHNLTRAEVGSRSKVTEGLLKTQAALFILRGLLGRDMYPYVRGVLVPFHVSAWVYGYWAWLYEDLMKWNEEKQAKEKQ